MGALPFALRDYQEEAIQAIEDAHAAGKPSGFIWLPTGTGKSVIQSVSATKANGRVAYIVPWDVLVDNAVTNLSMVFNANEIGVVKAKRNDTDARVVVASVQTLLSKKRIDPLLGQFNRVFVDEGHYFAADQWSRVALSLASPDGITVGFSATIGRQDRRGLSDIFGEILYVRELVEMIDAGWLCPLDGLAINAQIDLSKITRTAGDYDQAELGEILKSENRKELIFQGWKKYAGDRVTLVFTPTVAVAVEYADYWNKQGVPSTWVSGELPENTARERIDQFTSGEAQVMCQCQKLGVGFDHPPISCVLLARPTRSQTFYIQAVGRGTRICRDDVYNAATLPIRDRVQQNKRNCLIIDIGGSTDLGLQQFPDLFDLPTDDRNDAAAQMQRGQLVTSTGIITQHQEMLKAKGIIAKRVDLFKESDFHWVKTQYGWTISIGSSAVIVEQVKKTDTYHVYVSDTHANGTLPTYLHQSPVSLRWAMAIAESWVSVAVKDLSLAKTLVDPNAAWRGVAITEKQFNFLVKMRIIKPQDYAAYLQNEKHQLSRGQANELISARLAERAVRRRR